MESNYEKEMNKRNEKIPYEKEMNKRNEKIPYEKEMNKRNEKIPYEKEMNKRNEKIPDPQNCFGGAAINQYPQIVLGGVFLLEVQYSILKSLISTCVLSYVGSREDWLLDRICES